MTYSSVSWLRIGRPTQVLVFKSDATHAKNIEDFITFETIADFKSRFNHALVQSNQIAPPDEDLAADFSCKLDNMRYGTYKALLDNNQLLGIGNYPGFLSEAFAVSSQFKVTSIRQPQTVTSPAVFVSQDKGESHGKTHQQSKPAKTSMLRRRLSAPRYPTSVRSVTRSPPIRSARRFIIATSAVSSGTLWKTVLGLRSAKLL